MDVAGAAIQQPGEQARDRPLARFAELATGAQRGTLNGRPAGCLSCLRNARWETSTCD